MTTQSIIVYRNPAEAAFWESGMAIPLGGALIVGFIVFVMLTSMADRYLPRFLYKKTYRDRKNIEAGSNWVAALIAIGLAITTFNFLVI